MSPQARAELVAAYRVELKQARPRFDQGASYADLVRWQSSPRGMRSGERYRAKLGTRNSRGRGPTFQAMTRGNRLMRSRTQFSGPDGVERLIPPHERVNLVGVRSRRRHLSAQYAPPPIPRRKNPWRYGRELP